ncbi:hypothetical protein [Pyrobaculum sp.]|uniref:hypothetical protein n=1 Tax=Pyrobaculum sp. TaxID=2004705 RepID=UPI003D0ACF13
MGIFRVGAALLAAAVLALAGAEVEWTYQPPLPNGSSLALCEAGQHIYVVGYAAVGQRPNGSTPMWHVEMLRKADGALVKTWSWPGGSGELWACAAAGGKLVAVGDGHGRWSILLFGPNLTLMKLEVEDVAGIPYAVAVGGRYIYVAGAEYLGRYSRWRVEKRSLDDLTLLAVYTASSLGEVDRAVGIGVNPATGEIWVVGARSGAPWTVEILDGELRRVEALGANLSTSPTGVVFDDEGNAYVYGTGYVVKYSKEGRELARTWIGADTARGAAYLGGVLYLATEDFKLITIPPGGWGVRSYVPFTDLARAVKGHATVVRGAVYSQGHIYVAGGNWLVLSVATPNHTAARRVAETGSSTPKPETQPTPQVLTYVAAAAVATAGVLAARRRLVARRQT